MNARVLLMVRLFLVAALFPALAGCMQTEGEPLTRGDIAAPVSSEEPIQRAWADPADAEIWPGIAISTEMRDCLSNFIFTRPDNGAVFIGTSAYCVRDLPLGSPAIIGGGTNIGILVYSSWQTMSDVGETDPAAHEYNDFALFHLDSVAASRTTPLLREGPGPRGVADGDAAETGDRVRTYAHTPDLPAAIAWREGVVTGRVSDWALLVHNVLPGAPGSMGGPVMDADGRGVGVMVNMGVLPDPGANGIARLDRLLAYLHEVGQFPVELAVARDA